MIITLIVFGIIGLNLMITLQGFKAFQGEGGDPSDFLFEPYQVKRGRNIKGMIVSNFAHANWIHFGFNMYVFYGVAQNILYLSNIAGFMLILFTSAVVGDLVIYFRRKDDSGYKSLGASGYVTGLLFALVIFMPQTGFGILFIPGISIPAPIFAVLFVGISYYLMKQDRGGISHEGHLGGALGGFVAAIFVAPSGLLPLIAWFVRLIT